MNTYPASISLISRLKSSSFLLIFLLSSFTSDAGDLTIDGHLTVQSNLTVVGKISGDGGGLTNVPCAGITTNAADGRFVNSSGDIMTGPLTNLGQMTAFSFKGLSNTALGTASLALGGINNIAHSNYSIVVGGINNEARSTESVVVGGYNNIASYQSVIVGGYRNLALPSLASVVGGYYNYATNAQTFIGGGFMNCIGGQAASILGGFRNEISIGWCAAIAGGYYNKINEYSVHSFIGGGCSNIINYGQYSAIAGGRNNFIGSHNAFAAGTRAKATNQGAFVWADATDADYFSNYSNSVNMRANGGFWFDGGSIHGNGANLTNLPLDSRYATSTGSVFVGAVTIQTNLIVNGSALLAYVPQQGDISMGIYTNQAP